MSEYGFYFNQDKCVGCKTCTLACKTWNEGRRGDAGVNPINEDIVKANPEFYQKTVGGAESAFSFIDSTGADNYAEMRKYYMKEDWRKVTTYDSGAVTLDANNCFVNGFSRTYMSQSCNHCKQPKCIEACPMGVYYKEGTYGLTLYDNSKCISCGRCKDACPWDVPQFYDKNFASYALNDPKRPRMTKCTGCLDRLRAGLKPACVAACWNRALDYGPMDELRMKYNNDVTSTLPQFSTNGTGPMVIFRAKKNRIS